MNDQPASELAPRLYAQEENGSTVVLQLRKHRGYGKRFFTMFESSSLMLAEMDRPPGYFRTLLYLMAVLDPVQFRRISVREIAKGSSQSMSSVNRAMAMLTSDRTVITRGRASAMSRRLNNRLVWASNSERFNEVEPDPEVFDSRGR